MGDARIRCCSRPRAQQRIRALGWLTAAHVGLPRWTVIDNRLEDHRPYFQAALAVEPGGLGHEHRLPANDQRLALSSAPGWGRSQGCIADVWPFERRAIHNSQWPGLERRRRISAFAMPSLHRPMEASISQQIAVRAAVGTGESAFSIPQLPHNDVSLQPALSGCSQVGMYRYPTQATASTAGLSLDAALGRGLVTSALQTLVLRRTLPGTPGPAVRRWRGSGTSLTAGCSAQYQLSGSAIQPTHQRQLP